MDITLRFIDPDNASVLGYDVVEYTPGRWVIESIGGAWIADVPRTVTATEDAQAYALYVVPADQRDGHEWIQLIGNYGTAFDYKARV